MTNRLRSSIAALGASALLLFNSSAAPSTSSSSLRTSAPHTSLTRAARSSGQDSLPSPSALRPPYGPPRAPVPALEFLSLGSDGHARFRQEPDSPVQGWPSSSVAVWLVRPQFRMGGHPIEAYGPDLRTPDAPSPHPSSFLFHDTVRSTRAQRSGDTLSVSLESDRRQWSSTGVWRALSDAPPAPSRTARAPASFPVLPALAAPPGSITFTGRWGSGAPYHLTFLPADSCALLSGPARDSGVAHLSIPLRPGMPISASPLELPSGGHAFPTPTQIVVVWPLSGGPAPTTRADLERRMPASLEGLVMVVDLVPYLRHLKEYAAAHMVPAYTARLRTPTSFPEPDPRLESISPGPRPNTLALRFRFGSQPPFATSLVLDLARLTLDL